MSKVIVVGGGLAGLMATIKMAENGTHVDLFPLFQLKGLIPSVHKGALMEL